MSSAEPLYTDAVLQIAAHRNLLILAWNEAPGLEQMHECNRLARTLCRKHPSGIGMLDLVISGTPRFNNEVRDEAVKLLRDPKLFRLGVADTLLVSGLVGVAVRSFLSTVALIARPAIPHRIFGNLGEASAWLAPQLSLGGETWSPATILEIAEPIVKSRTPKSSP